MTSHIRKKSVDGTVETEPHSAMIDNRHLAFVVVTILNLTLKREHRAWGADPFTAWRAPQNLVTFHRCTIQLLLASLISIAPRQEHIRFYHLT